MTFFFMRVVMLDAFFFDLPYGVLPKATAKWDEKLSEEDLRNVLSSLQSIMKKEYHHVGFWCYWKQLAELASVLEEKGYTGISTVYWHKSNQTVVGAVENLTYSVEVMLVATFKRPGATPYFCFSDDPRERHNFIETPTMSQYLHYTDRNNNGKVNVTQKPVEVAKWFFQRYCRFGATVLIAGTGAGGEVVAALECGLNVIGFDTDKEQIDALAAHIETLEAREAKKKADAEKEAAAKKGSQEVSALTEFQTSQKTVAACETCGAKKEEGEPELICENCGTPQCQKCGYKPDLEKTDENRIFCGDCSEKQAAAMQPPTEKPKDAVAEPQSEAASEAAVGTENPPTEA